jgi:hypothetical protein
MHDAPVTFTMAARTRWRALTRLGGIATRRSQVAPRRLGTCARSTDAQPTAALIASNARRPKATSRASSTSVGVLRRVSTAAATASSKGQP